MKSEYETAKKAGWVGDIADDCFLTRHGMMAHVEKMGGRHWWFCITDEHDARDELYNSSDSAFPLPLTSGAKARCAAECVMDCLRQFPG